MKASNNHPPRLLPAFAIVPALLLGVSGTHSQDLPVVEDQHLHMAARNTAGEVILRLTAFQTSGGSIPVGYVLRPLGPSDIIDDPDENGNGAVRSDLTTIQHTYAASFDIDLAPVGTDLPPRFDSDTFDPEGNKFLRNIALRDVNDGVNNKGGFRVEDHKYEIPRGTWVVGGVDIGYIMGFDKLDWPFYHGPECSPRLCDYYDDPGAWAGRPPISDALEAFRSAKRYLMTCNVGPQFLTGALPDPSNVVAVGETLPSVGADTSIIAHNGTGLRLITGPLASFWQPAIFSPLRIAIQGPVAVSAAEYAWTLLWPVSAGRNYQLESSADLVNWATVPDGHSIAGGNATQEVRGSSSSGRVFYRVVQF